MTAWIPYGDKRIGVRRADGFKMPPILEQKADGSWSVLHLIQLPNVVVPSALPVPEGETDA